MKKLICIFTLLLLAIGATYSKARASEFQLYTEHDEHSQNYSSIR